jgi:hypothetical protein
MKRKENEIDGRGLGEMRKKQINWKQMEVHKNGMGPGKLAVIGYDLVPK